MPRPVSKKVQAITDQLESGLLAGLYRPGERFLSNRALCQRFEISYQTAHRILSKLEQRGLIKRKRGSGTVVAGERALLNSAGLVFHPRVRVPGTFGHYLTAQLEAGLKDRHVPYRLLEPGQLAQLSATEFPVLWDLDDLSAALSQLRGPCLLLNQKPPLGLAARWVDSISVDDRSGGMAAGDLARLLYGARRPAVLAGPRSDGRSRERAEGFQMVFAQAPVVWAGSWGQQVSAATLRRLTRHEPDAVFCANDRLALRARDEAPWPGRRPPPVIGFDNAIVARQHQLTTISIPWDQLISTAVRVIERRLAGDSTPASHAVLSLEPVVRG